MKMKRSTLYLILTALDVAIVLLWLVATVRAHYPNKGLFAGVAFLWTLVTAVNALVAGVHMGKDE